METTIPQLKDISELITQIETLKETIRQFAKKRFLTKIQKEAAAATTNTAFYLWKLNIIDEGKFNRHFGSITDYFLLTGKVGIGRFVLTGNSVDYYNRDQHGPLAVRCKFDVKLLWNYLNMRRAKTAKKYWEKRIRPLITRLDFALTPWLPFITEKTGFDIRKNIISLYPDNHDTGKLDDVIYQLRRCKSVVKLHPPNKSERKSGGGKPGEIGLLQPKVRKQKKKSPAQFYKEARERNAASLLASNPNLTAKELGDKLECHKTTVIRLEAWKNKGVNNGKIPNGYVKTTDEDRTIEAIDDSE